MNDINQEEELLEEEVLEEVIPYTEEDLKENQTLTKKSNRKVRTFLTFTSLIVVFYFAFKSNPLFIFNFSSNEEELQGATILFNFLSYLLIVSSFIYMFFYMVYFRKRKQKTIEEQMASFGGFKKHYNVFDLLGVVPVFLSILTLINGLFLGFATVVGPSMEPTFCPSDYVIIDHYTYDFAREDIMIFIHDGSKLIKRVIAVPGDTLVVDNTGVYVNGVLVETYFPSSYFETYNLVLPEGSYYVMGDNRHNSNDSRSFGIVTEDLILGEVIFQIGGNSCSIG